MRKKVLIAAMSATVLSSPALAAPGIPTFDAAQAAHALAMIKQAETEIANLTQLANLQTIAGQVFGETGAGWGAVISGAQDAYSGGQYAYNSVMSVPTQFAAGATCLQAPPGGYATMDIQGTISRLQCAQRLTNGSNQAAVKALADRLDMQRRIQAEQAKAGMMSGASVSPIQATQAQTAQLRVLAAQMQSTQNGINDLVQIAASKELREQQERDAIDGMRIADASARAQTIEQGPSEPQHSPLDWGK